MPALKRGSGVAGSQLEIVGVDLRVDPQAIRGEHIGSSLQNYTNGWRENGL